MDWKLFFTTFVAVFFAELGDKTQLSALLFAAKSQKIWTVFFAASLALVSVTLIGVLLADVVTQFVSQQTIKKFSALLFILMGLLIFFDKL